MTMKVIHSLFWSLPISTQNLYTCILFILSHCLHLFDAFIKVIQPVSKKASAACSINMHVLECDSQQHCLYSYISFLLFQAEKIQLFCNIYIHLQSQTNPNPP